MDSTEIETDNETPIHSLPPEILVKIFTKDGISFLDKKRSRLVCKYWKNVIDNNNSNVGVGFHVILNNKTVNAVQNLTWPKIDYLMIDELTKEFDIFSSFPQGIKTLKIGPANSAFNFWSALSSCGVKKVEHLELENNPAMDLEADNRLHFPMPNFEFVKKLTMRVQNVDTRGQELEIVKTGWDSVIKILRLIPSLETISFLLDCSAIEYPSGLSYFYDLLCYNIRIKFLALTILPLSNRSNIAPDSMITPYLGRLQLEKLDLRLDFRWAHVVNTLMRVSNHKLKQLHLKCIGQSYMDAFTYNGYVSLMKLVHMNSPSLEFLSIAAVWIYIVKLQLENCHSLKVLKLKFHLIGSIPERLRIPSIQTLKIKILPTRGDMINWPTTTKILAVVEHNLEEFTMDYYEGFDILQFQRLLGLPKIKKIVVKGMTEPHPPLIIAHCNNALDIATTWVNKYGRTDYHITIQRI